jgi:hypothetical protein
VLGDDLSFNFIAGSHFTIFHGKRFVQQLEFNDLFMMGQVFGLSFDPVSV